jgi:SAM-dependent methyltransferase
MGSSVESYDPFFAPDNKLLQHEYDFVVCIEVAEHFFWPAKEFQSLYRLLKPGGWLALMTKLLTGDQSLQSWWYAKDPTHVSLYSRASLDWIEKRWGWRLHSSSEEIHLFQKLGDPDCS